eukprot:4637009-Prymnesium_polylepis.2
MAYDRRQHDHSVPRAQVVEEGRKAPFRDAGGKRDQPDSDFVLGRGACGAEKAGQGGRQSKACSGEAP